MDDRIASLTAQLVSAHIAANEVPTTQLPTLIRNVHQALATAGQVQKEPAKIQPAVAKDKSVFADHILCLGCGGSFKMLRRHIAADHRITPQEYRIRWGLPPTYPMVAPDYAATRSQLAKASGLGRRFAQAPPPKRRGRPRRS